MTLTALKAQAPAQVIWQDATPECEVGDIIRKAFAPIARVVGKETLKDGRSCLIVTFPNCRDRHREEWVVGEVAAPVVEVAEVEVEAPAASAPAHTAETLKTLTWNQVQKLHTSLGLKATVASRTRHDCEARILAAQLQPAEIVATATTDDAPPNRGDNGRNRVEAKAPIAPTPKSHSSSAPILGCVKLKQPPIWAYIPPSQVLETIVWQTPFKGEILGKNGYRPFFIKNDCICGVKISHKHVLCERVTKSQHHKLIRQAIEAGKTFDPAAFKQRANARGGPSPKYQTYWWKDAEGRSCNLGQLYQNCDGWWWAWASQNDREGRKFQRRIQAQNYLEIAAGKPVTQQGFSNHPFRYRRDIFNGQHSSSSASYGLCECDRCKMSKIDKEVAELSNLITELETAEPIAPKSATTTDKEPNWISAVAPMTEPSTPATIAQTPRAREDDNFMTAFTQESPGDRKFNDLAYLAELEMKAQKAIERTVIGSEEEAIAYRYLRSIERDIEFYGKPKPEPQVSPVVAQLETQMNELKAEVKQYTIDPSILALIDKSEPIPARLDPEGTIYWETPLRGTIVGKKGVRRSFYLRNRDYFGGDKNYPTAYDVNVVMSAEFTASESKRPNIRHAQIRAAIEAGRAFDPIAFKQSPQFKSATEDCDGIGRIMQSCDGRWWAWATTGITGHAFFSRQDACKYLDKIAEGNQLARKSVACVK